ncbi:MAG: T9SS type A sorting domain-containing protein [Ignavibacteria bacterium]|nr:T9SS type A sorting domain-containing protein [Ignavibacteria bacterium]
MKLCTAFLLALCATLLPVKATSIFDHVSRVNSEWNNPVFSVDAFRNERSNDTLSERRLVQLHLQSVIRLLKTRSITGLSANQLQARANNIALLVGYAEAGSFPRNITHRGRIPVFVDDRNVPCAVGYLMLLAGYTDFVGETRTNVNNIYIRQIKSDVFTKFHAESGLTLDELALIQPWYGEHIEFTKVAPPEVIVKVFTRDSTRGLLYAYGAFTNINGVAMNNLAVFNGASWSAIPNDIKGKVTCMAVLNGELFVGGRFTMGNDSIFGLARYDGKSWVKFSELYEVRCIKEFEGRLFIGGKLDTAEKSYSKYFATYSSYYKKFEDYTGAHFNAPINAITVHMGTIIVGGEFTKNYEDEQLYLSGWNRYTGWQAIESPFTRSITALHSGSGGEYTWNYPVLYVGSSGPVPNLRDSASPVIAVKEFLKWFDHSNATWINLRYQIPDHLSEVYVSGFETLDKLQDGKEVVASIQTPDYGYLIGFYYRYDVLSLNILSFYRFGKSAPSIQFFNGNLYIGTDTLGLLKSNMVITTDVDENTPLASSLTVVGQSRESVTFRLPSEPHTQVSMSLVDILGVEVSREVVPAGDQLTLHTSNLSQGAYYARITADGKYYTKKLLVSY